MPDTVTSRILKKSHYADSYGTQLRASPSQFTVAQLLRNDSCSPERAKQEIQRQAKEQLNTEFGSEGWVRQKVACNWKMRMGIAVGVLVGVAVLAVVLGAVVASHGTLGAVLGLLATKLSMGSTWMAQGLGAGATATPWLAQLISTVIVAVVFLGGGKIGGELFRRGEVEAMNQLFPKTTQQIHALEEQVLGTGRHLTQEQIDAQIADKQAHILSSQAGRDFLEAKRQSYLHYTGWMDLLTSPVKVFGHFWTSVPITALKSITDRKQYDRFCLFVEREKELKQKSVGPGGAEALKKLNQMRKVQIERLVWGNDHMGDGYAKAPEMQIYDQNVARLEVLRTEAARCRKDTLEIDQQIQIEQQKKYLLMQQRLEKAEVKDKLISEKSPIASLLSIADDVMALNGLSDEQKGQILEAISVLLTRDSKISIGEINQLVHGLSIAFRGLEVSADQHWKTRESVINQSIAFVEALTNGNASSFAFKLQESDEVAPMTREKGRFLVLRALDIAISLIHMLPVPGAAFIAGSVTGLAIAKEKGINPFQGRAKEGIQAALV